MKRKKKGGGGASWMDTYGDMVTLLLCFFVLLYSISTISEENWKALVMSFNPNAVLDQTETSGNEGAIADPTPPEEGDFAQAQAKVDQDIEALYQALRQYINEEGAQSSISVTKEGGKVFVSFNQAVFFDGNSWTLRQESLPILDTVSGMLDDVADSIEEVRILGHTAQEVPDEPNDPQIDRFLASNRATNVLVYIQTHTENLDPGKLVSEGLGQHRPVASDDTAEGRAKNRRVEMIVSGRDIEAELAGGIQQYETSN